MAEYSNVDVYIVLPAGKPFPVGIAIPALGEGVNRGVFRDGRTWQKNCFLSPEEMRSVVHAEDAGKLELKTSAEMRTILDAQIVVEIPL